MLNESAEQRWYWTLHEKAGLLYLLRIPGGEVVAVPLSVGSTLAADVAALEAPKSGPALMSARRLNGDALRLGGETLVATNFPGDTWRWARLPGREAQRYLRRT